MREILDFRQENVPIIDPLEFGTILSHPVRVRSHLVERPEVAYNVSKPELCIGFSGRDIGREI